MTSIRDLQIADGAHATVGSTTDAEVATGNATEIAILKRLRTLLSRSATAAPTNVNVATTSTSVLSANSARTGFTITNDSSVTVYIKYGTTATTTSYTVALAAGDAMSDTDWLGVVFHIAGTATGALRVTEFTL
jgi:hypothetical protein